MKWKKAKLDVKYDIGNSPFGLELGNLNKEQAEENFNWFISNIQNRIDYLVHRCASDLKIPESYFDYSPSTLVALWKWFLKTARIEKTPDDVIYAMKQTREYKLFGESYINYIQFSNNTEYIMRDIGMYLGQVFIINNKNISWGYYTKPKTDVHVNTPLLKGFRVNLTGTEGDAYFEPAHMVGVQAVRLFHKTSTDNDLLNLYLLWLEHVPKH